MTELLRYRYEPGRIEFPDVEGSVTCQCPECGEGFEEDYQHEEIGGDEEGYHIIDGKAGQAIAFVYDRDIAELVVQRLNEGEARARAQRLAKAYRQRNPTISELWSENGL